MVGIQLSTATTSVELLLGRCQKREAFTKDHSSTGVSFHVGVDTKGSMHIPFDNTILEGTENEG
jgi:hypothetical protein